MLRFEKCEKSNNDGLCLGVEVEKGISGGNAHMWPDNGQDAPGLSALSIEALADWCTERAYADAQETGGDTRTAELDAALRQRLADEGVLWEYVEIEFKRVMTVVFRA